MSRVAYINASRCDQSPFCPAKRACPQKAISQSGGGLFGGGTSKVDESQCTGCGLCLNYCPAGAISMKNK